MEDGSFLHMNLKMTPKWAWPGSPDPIKKFWDPHISGKTSKVNYVYINNNKTVIKAKTKVYNDVYITQLKLQK